MEIRLFDGSRDLLDALFAEADDSPSQIDLYKRLGDVLIAKIDGEVVGEALVVEIDQTGMFEVKSLAVVEPRRSQGIGAALMTAAAGHCRERGGHTILVATAAASIGALQFYQRLGFRIRHVIRDFYSPERGYAPMEINGIALRDEVIFDLAL